MTDIDVDLNGGFYTAREAARLIGIGSTRIFLHWLEPTAKGAAPIILRQYQKAGQEHEVGFLDLLEIRFVEHFHKTISLQSLRVAATNARKELKVSHPFATSNVKFQSDRKQIFLETAKQTGDRQLLNLMTNQAEIYEVIEQILAKDLEFDVSGFARLWRPRAGDCPNVVVSPVWAFGQPVIGARRVPTSAIFRTWRAEDGDYAAAAEWYEVTTDEAREAIEFELRLAH